MVNAMYQNILAWEEELFIANKVQGIIDANTALTSYTYPMTTRQNIRYMRMFAGAFMYAAGNHVGVEYGSTARPGPGQATSATGEGNANGLFGWGIATRSATTWTSWARPSAPTTSTPWPSRPGTAAPWT